MFWFKHFTNRHEDIDLIESVLLYGSSAYHLYFVLHELYGRQFNKLTDEKYLEITYNFLRYKTKISKAKIKEIIKALA